MRQWSKSPKAKRPVIPESMVLNACIRYLYAIGLQPIRNNSGAHKKEYTNKSGVKKTYHIRYGKPGSGDILVCLKGGKWCEVEVKSDAGQQEDAQIARQEHIEDCQGIYLLVHSVEELEQALKPYI